MSTLATPSPVQTLGRDFDTVAELLHSLGDVPPSRVIWNPRPGTATERDVIQLVERHNRLCELIDGTLVEKGMGSFESAIATFTSFFLLTFLESNPIGTVLGADGMVRMISGGVRLPDVSFFSKARLSGAQLRAQPIVPFAPDLAVEVISASNTEAEISRKRKELFASGTVLMWVIFPEEEVVDVFTGPTEAPFETLNRDGVLDGRGVLPGFSLPLEKLFSKISK